MNTLIYVGIVLIVVALIAYVLGARGLAGFSASLGKTLLIVGLVIGAIVLIIGALT